MPNTYLLLGTCAVRRGEASPLRHAPRNRSWHLFLYQCQCQTHCGGFTKGHKLEQLCPRKGGFHDKDTESFKLLLHSCSRGYAFTSPRGTSCLAGCTRSCRESDSRGRSCHPRHGAAPDRWKGTGTIPSLLQDRLF